MTLFLCEVLLLAGDNINTHSAFVRDRLARGGAKQLASALGAGDGAWR